MEGNFNQGIKKDTEKLSIEESSFLDKLFWKKSESGEIIKVKDLNSKIIREIGNEVFSNGRCFQAKGTKGIIKSFREDTCYIGVEWEDGTISFMKDKDLIEDYLDGKQEKEFLIKRGLEIFNSAYSVALKLENKSLLKKISSFKDDIKNPDLKIEDLLYTIKECKKFIDKNKNL